LLYFKLLPLAVSVLFFFTHARVPQLQVLDQMNYTWAKLYPAASPGRPRYSYTTDLVLVLAPDFPCSWVKYWRGGSGNLRAGFTCNYTPGMEVYTY